MTALQARGQGVAGAGGQQAGGVPGPGPAAPSDQGHHRLRGSSTGLPPLAPGGRAPALEGHMDPVRVTQGAAQGGRGGPKVGGGGYGMEGEEAWAWAVRRVRKGEP
ncbi:hypothetical protein HaLaN_00065 [Haematococcus lacustris]|uniref:Uncharacterized protein n=1 Tax=Haematococcus lacustris TaxID=44745 RepID=A0A699Y8I8_HAELA|nr:hypothetical protein HaLaN_00065 [Haematococcus lacustris]